MATRTIDGVTADFQEGGWYSGRRYLGGQLLAPGEYEPGKMTSNEVIAQTNPDNVSYVQQQRSIFANQITPPVNLSLPNSSTSDTQGLQDTVNKYRDQLNNTITTRLDTINADLAEKRKTEQDTLQKVGEISQPFREDLENTERERLYINQNFEANQSLVNELDQLLTEGNELVRQQQEVTGLASVRNPRIQKTMEDVQSRAYVIEAVINARNGQIAQAQNLIDRSINAIAADRQDRLNYYNTILELNNRDILNLTQESKELAQEQRSIIASDLANAQSVATTLKEYMLDPEKAALIGQAGVKLNDSIETINYKLTQAQLANELKDQHNQFTSAGYQPVFDPSSVPAGELRSFTDSQGNEHYYRKPPEPISLSSAKQGQLFANEVYDTGGVVLESENGKKVTITPDIYTDIYNEYAYEVAPQFSAPVGQVYIDTYGNQWQSTGNSWVQI